MANDITNPVILTREVKFTYTGFEWVEACSWNWDQTLSLPSCYPESMTGAVVREAQVTITNANSMSMNQILIGMFLSTASNMLQLARQLIHIYWII